MDEGSGPMGEGDVAGDLREALKRVCSVENTVFALEPQSFKLDNVRPHPSPRASQARHESVPRDETFASRNVVPQERVKQRPSSNDRISFQQSQKATKFPRRLTGPVSRPFL